MRPVYVYAYGISHTRMGYNKLNTEVISILTMKFCNLHPNSRKFIITFEWNELLTNQVVS